MSQNNIAIAVLVGAALIAGVIFLSGRTSAPVAERWEDNLTPVDSLSYQFSNNHLHGLGYDSENERVFLASHYGLFVIQDDQLYQLGNNRDDFMGFSLNQRDPQIIYTSGHPRTGGNLGVMRSEDGGLTFERIALGDRMAVDFHSMAISYANPDILYGIFRGQLYRSDDGGYSWEQIQAHGAPISDGFCWHAPCMSADTQDENTLYAGTVAGLAVSRNLGETWEVIENGAGVIVSVGVDPQNNERLFAFTENYSVAESVDGGKTWEERSDDLQLGAQEVVFAFSFDVNNSDRMFFATTENKVYRTENGGETWEEIL